VPGVFNEIHLKHRSQQQGAIWRKTLHFFEIKPLGLMQLLRQALKGMCGCMANATRYQ
jgi:hypothetical protein